MFVPEPGAEFFPEILREPAGFFEVLVGDDVHHLVIGAGSLSPKYPEKSHRFLIHIHRIR